jgi:A/G-specific adenine glycosylase
MAFSLSSMKDSLSAQAKLLKWYRENRRDLPWRRTKDPYAILVSEIMLQQTTVKVVVPYFEKFLKSFPTAQALAKASEEKVLSQWSGLGYYSRARNLQKAAKTICELLKFPQTYSELLSLKGVGPYTAAAVASIAFDESVAAVDGNVSRVISRLHDIDLEITSRPGKLEINKRAQEFITGQPASEHNQAMMELGATICLPSSPVCMLCPLSFMCMSFKNGTVKLRPVKIKKPKQEPWVWTLFVVKKGDKIALTKSDNGTPWLKNTWVMPGEAQRWTKTAPPKSDFRHSITHHKIYVQIKNATVKEIGDVQKIKWLSFQKIEQFGVSSVVQKALKILQTSKASSKTPTLLGIALVFVFAALTACSSKPIENKIADTETIQVDLAAPEVPLVGVQPLTHLGENAMPAFSPDGTKLMFQSRNRPDHRNAQIYVYDFKTRRERRLTYNDGEDASPQFAPTGKQIIYSSTTDELKEETISPQYLKAQGSAKNSGLPFLNYEIYSADSDGSHRVRITNSKGYDAEAAYTHSGQKIIFISRRNGENDLFEMNPQNPKSVHRFYTSAHSKGNPAFSPDGKHVVWSERLEEGSAQIMMSDTNGRNIKQLTTKIGLHINPQFTPDGKALLFSSNRQTPSHFDIYYLLLNGSTCLARLTNSTGIDLFPILSPNGKILVFTSNKLGSFQIYHTPLTYPIDCIAEDP